MRSKTVCLPAAGIFAALISLIVSSPSLDAQLFGVNAAPAAGPEISVKGSSIIDLVENLLDADKEFAALDNQAWTAEALYFGVPKALQFESNADRTVVTLTSRLTGLDVTFTGVDSDEVEDELVDWLKADGSKELAKLDKEIRKRSAAALSDGNPNAATAMIANSAFRGFTMGEVTGGIAYSFGQFDVDTPSGTMKGEQHRLNLRPSFRIGERVAFMWDIPIDYTEIEGTDIYGVGMNMGLRVNILKPSEERQYAWGLTPFAGVMARGSADAASGALVWQAGIGSKFDYTFSEKVVLTVGNQVSTFSDISISYDDYEFEQDISQTITKNGARVGYRIFPKVELDASLVNTYFFEDAVIGNYWTAGGGIAYRFGEKDGVLGLFGNYDFASGYDGWSVGLAFGRKW